MEKTLYKLRNKLWIFAIALIPLSMLMMVLPADKELVPLSMIELMGLVPWIFCALEAVLLILSIILFLKRIGNKLNIILVCSSLLIIGMFGILGLKADVSRSPEKFEQIEKEIGVDFSNDLDLISNEMPKYLTIIAKFEDEKIEEVSSLDIVWNENIDKASLEKIPDSLAKNKIFTSGCYLIYNSTKSEFVKSIEHDSNDKFIFIGYDESENVLTICKEK